MVGPAQDRAGQPLPQRLAVTEAQDGQHPPGIDSLRGSNRNTLRPKRFNEPNQVTRQAMRRQRLWGRTLRTAIC